MRLHLVAAVAALLLGSCLVSAQAPVNVLGYNCPPTCASNPHCQCASFEVPGGLSPSDIPQFVVLTNDDAITVTSMPTILGITDKHTNKKNGCNIPFTWFVSIQYTDPDLVQEVYMKNHEIASHTYNHVQNPGVAEIVNAKLWLNQTAHVPLEKIKGFRAPFLVHNEEQRTILNQNGFTYDSSIPEMFPTATSPEAGKRLWPYTMDYGLPQRCDLGTGTCAVNESHPGLWEFPMWDIQDADGKMIAPMDPPGDLFEAYKREFDRNYNGNRAPVGVYIHAARLLEEPSRIDQLNAFIDYASSKENVWFATVTQVLEWIKNPVPASDYNYNKGCKAPTDMWFPSGSFCKKVQCINGNWSDVTCTCSCAGEFLKQQPGFCLDPNTKACTVAKLWDDDARIYYCPGKPRDEPQKTAAPVQTKEDVFTPSCGHDLLSYSGVGTSSSADGASAYTDALNALDGSCKTCASISGGSNYNYFMVRLPEPIQLKGVYVVTKNSLKNAAVLAGNDTRPENNPPCASKLDITGASPSIINCNHTASVITLAVASELKICDFYPLAWNTPEISAWNLEMPQLDLPPSPSPKPQLPSRKLRRLD